MSFLSGVFGRRDKGKDAEANSGEAQSGVEEQAASQTESGGEHVLPMATNESAVQAPGKQKRVTVADSLPDIDYPSPLMVRNTFIHYSCDDDQLGERTVRSCPNSAIMEPGVEAEHMPAIDEVPQLDAVPTDDGIQFETPVKPSTITSATSAEVECSSKSRSTRAETSPGSDEDRPDSNAVASPAQVQAEQPALDGPAYVTTSGPGLSVQSSRPGLPDFEYPAPYSVTNTFIHAKVGREPSLDGFYHERQLVSCISAIGGNAGEETPHAERVAEAAAAAIDNEVANLPGGFQNPAWPFGSVCETPQNAFGMLPNDGGWPCAIPPPPVAAPPMMAPPMQQEAACAVPPEPPAGLPPAGAALGSARAEKTPVLMLSEAVPQPALGSSEIPTLGSQAHRWGTCNPCAYAHSSRGCKNGVECEFCHLCEAGELKRRQKLKRMAQRRQTAAGGGPEFQVFPQM